MLRAYLSLPTLTPPLAFTTCLQYSYPSLVRIPSRDKEPVNDSAAPNVSCFFALAPLPLLSFPPQAPAPRNASTATAANSRRMGLAPCRFLALPAPLIRHVTHPGGDAP